MTGLTQKYANKPHLFRTFKIFFSYSTGLVTHEHATEISALQQARKIKPSAMNPFIMMSGLDPSQVCK